LDMETNMTLLKFLKKIQLLTNTIPELILFSIELIKIKKLRSENQEINVL